MHLNDYLARIRLAHPLPPTLDTLRRIHVAHLAAFPFDNLAIQRHGAIAVDVDSIERKFLSSNSGGYCFEHNTLLGAALRELGFNVTTLLGRVGTSESRRLNHMLLRVEVDDEPWLADVGFGAEAPLEPMPLREGTHVDPDGVAFRLRREGLHWKLSMHIGDDVDDMYEFSDAPFTAGDVEMANYYTSTHPSSVFRHTITIQRATREERLILRPKVITRYRGGVRVDTPIEPSDVRRFARELFGIELGEETLLFEMDSA